ncbi:MAG: hypothetical protein AAFX92_11480 [Pseudomonadota bacterium]
MTIDCGNFLLTGTAAAVSAMLLGAAIAQTAAEPGFFWSDWQ